IVLAAAAALSGCSKPVRPPVIAPVLTAKAFITNVPVDIQPQPVGHVVAFSSVAVRPQIGGVLQRIHFQEGMEVKSNQLLLTIDRIHPIYVQFAVPERYLGEIKKQMAGHSLAVSATYENIVGDPPQGQLVFVDNSVDTMTGTIQLKATFSNESNILWPGQF